MYNDNIYFLLYKKIYNDNKNCDIHFIIFFLQDMMYNDDIYLSLYIVSYNTIYTRCIIKIFSVIIHCLL